MLDSKALTRIQSIIMVVIIVIAALSGALAYVLLSGNGESSKTIKIGVLADLDSIERHVWQSAVLAAEQLNKEGGLLGRKVEVFGEDNDFYSGLDMAKINSALTRLITYHNADFIIGGGSEELGYMLQDVIAEHKKVFIAFYAGTDGMTQRVFDDYDNYKYFFKYYPANNTQLFSALIEEFLYAREFMGFNEVGYLADDSVWTKGIIEGLDYYLPEIHGFDLVYRGKFPPIDTIDFTSYFAAAEAAGVELLMPLMAFDSGVAFLKEYHERQSPMIIFGGALSAAGQGESWEQTDGKCKYISTVIESIIAGYPLTSETLPFREAYIARWDEAPSSLGGATYDIIRYILSDALERAGTLETEAVIRALETTRIETSMARSFVFTSNHDVMYNEPMNDPDDYGFLSSLFQWQENGILVPVYPKKLMEEMGATFTYPDWPGPWD